MKVVIAGGTGFIGRHVASSLAAKGGEVWVISRREGPYSDGVLTPTRSGTIGRKSGSSLSSVKPASGSKLSGANPKAASGTELGGMVPGDRGGTDSNKNGPRDTNPGEAVGLPKQGGIRTVTWGQLESDPSMLEGTHAWINLAGETINRRWTKAGKAEILQSRIDATRRTAALISRLHEQPHVLLNGSAIGIYGSSEDATFTEDAVPMDNVTFTEASTYAEDETNTVAAANMQYETFTDNAGTHLKSADGDFLAEVAYRWETEAERVEVPRRVLLRIGLVLGSDGGALPKMMLPFRFGVGGRVGSGRQWMSWIHIDDVVRVVEYCLENEAVAGAVNVTAPNPVRNADFSRLLGRAMRRPAVFPLPAPVLKAVLGEMSVLLLAGQRVLPSKLEQHEFSFRYPRLADALEQILST